MRILTLSPSLLSLALLLSLLFSLLATLNSIGHNALTKEDAFALAGVLQSNKSLQELLYVWFHKEYVVPVR